MVADEFRMRMTYPRPLYFQHQTTLTTIPRRVATNASVIAPCFPLYAKTMIPPYDTILQAPVIPSPHD